MTIKQDVLDLLATHGPLTCEDMGKRLNLPSKSVFNALNKLSRGREIEGLWRGLPQWYAVKDDPRAARKRSELNHAPPTAREIEMDARRVGRELLPLITTAGCSELQIQKARPDLNISSIRAGLKMLLEQDLIVSHSAPGTARALYRLDVLDLPDPAQAVPDDIRRVERHLRQVSSAGAYDTLINISLTTGLSRARVGAALAGLRDTGGILRWKRVGALPIFRLVAPEEAEA